MNTLAPLTKREAEVLEQHQILQAAGVPESDWVRRITLALDLGNNTVAVYRQQLKRDGYIDFGPSRDGTVILHTVQRCSCCNQLVLSPEDQS